MGHRINMKGNIGQDFSGNYIAEEIDYFAGEVSVINLHINSFGGDVQQANSIMASMHATKTPIDTFNMGFAASSAFQVFLSGRDLYALDYARFMTHDPSVSDGKTIEEMSDDDPNKTALIEIRAQISEIISNRTGMAKDKVLELMKNETWFDVEKMQNTFGLSINVLPTKRQPVVKKNASVAEFVNIFSNFTPEIIVDDKEPSMDNFKKILNSLDLNENVSSPEDKISQAINTLQIENKAFTEKEKAWNKSKTELEDKIKVFEGAQKDNIEVEAQAFVDKLATDGVIREEGKEGIKKLYLADSATTKASFGDNLIHKIVDQIDPATGKRKKEESKLETFKDENGKEVTKDMNWMAENESETLNEWEAEANAGKNTEGSKKFKAMFLAEYNESYDKASSTPTGKED